MFVTTGMARLRQGIQAVVMLRLGQVRMIWANTSCVDTIESRQ